MASYPGNIYSPTNPSSTSPRNNPSLAGEVTGLNDEVVAIETALGANLGNVVTEIVAGSGASVNQGTGVVTIATTGGGSTSELVNGEQIASLDPEGNMNFPGPLQANRGYLGIEGMEILLGTPWAWQADEAPQTTPTWSINGASSLDIVGPTGYTAVDLLPASVVTGVNIISAVKNAQDSDVTLTPSGSDTIDGAGTLNLPAAASVILWSDGTSKWWILSSHGLG